MDAELAPDLNATDVLQKLNTANQASNSMLKPSDVAMMTLGYFSLAMSTFLLKVSIKVYRKTFYGPESHQNRSGHGEHNDFNAENVREEEIKDLLAEKVDAGIDCGCAISKLGLLLFLKMLFLPFLLGIWLDFSTLKLFESSIEERVQYAGKDIFGFVLLHWVLGITFMLFVTVSVLQLREVVHPDILARFIRPQEPQPDLLGNILQDSAWTHAKRMLPSLLIYATLLGIHIWVPAYLLTSFGGSDTLKKLQPKLNYILSPQLQIPLELFTFHFTMLALLEKHKNRIGELQHAWILKMCNLVRTTDHILPRKVQCFKLVGIRRLFALDSCQVDMFWNHLYDLHKNGLPTEQFIEKEMQQLSPPQVVTEKGLKKSGKMHLNYARPFISLTASYNPSLTPPRSSEDMIKRLPSSIGSYRFRRRYVRGEEDIIECWREVHGDIIPRPPEGWDDYLGDTGAVKTGRWAWADEKKSPIEKEVACRREFFPRKFENGIVSWDWKTAKFWYAVLLFLLKSMFVYFCSWVTIFLFTSTLIFGPLTSGRFLISVFRIPESYIHDPFAYSLGAIFLFPLLMKIADFLCREKNGRKSAVKTNRSILFPPRGKAVLLFKTSMLWVFVSPILLGFTYDSFFTKGVLFWKGDDLLSVKSFFESWVVGFTLLHCWLGMSYLGAFQRTFWTGIGALAVDGVPVGPENNNDNNDNRAQGAGRLQNPNRRNNFHRARDNDRHNDQDALKSSSDLHAFVDTMKVIFLHQEWDKADRSILLDNFTLPLCKRLMIVCIIPFTACFFSFPLMHSYCVYGIKSDNEEYRLRMCLYQLFTVVAILIEFCRTYRGPLQKWFKRAHKAARDHRYLIGEVLMNYAPPSNPTKISD